MTLFLFGHIIKTNEKKKDKILPLTNHNLLTHQGNFFLGRKRMNKNRNVPLLKQSETKNRKWYFYNGLVILTALFLVLATSFFYFYAIQRNVQKEIHQFLKEASSQSVLNIQNKIESDKKILTILAEVIGMEEIAPKNLFHLQILEEQKKNTYFDKLSLVKTDGTIIQLTGEKDIHIADQEQFQRVLSGESIVSSVFFHEQEKAACIVLAVPVYQEMKVVSVLMGTYFLDKWNILTDITSLDKKAFSCIVNGQGEILVSSSQGPDFMARRNLFDSLERAGIKSNDTAEQIKQNMQKNQNDEIRFAFQSENWIACYTPIEFCDWYYFSLFPEKVMLSKIDSQLYQGLAMTSCIVLTIASILFYFYLQRRKDNAKLQSLVKEREDFFNVIPGGMFQCTTQDQWKILYSTGGLYHFIGYSPQEFQMKFQNKLLPLIHPSDIIKAKRVQEAIKNEKKLQQEIRILCKDGKYRWIFMNGEFLQEKSGEENLYCTFVDITIQKEMQQQLEQERQRYTILMEQTLDIIVEWDIQTRRLQHSDAYQKKFKRDPIINGFPEEMIAQKLIYEIDIPVFQKFWEEMQEGIPYLETSYRVKQKENVYIWCKIRASAVLDKEGKTVQVIGIMTDIDEEKRREIEIEEKSRRDELTSLYNKATNEQLIQDYLLKRNLDEKAAMLLIDVDNFKMVNDTWGHVYGDLILAQIGRNLAKLFRKSDIIGRIGGDEFSVFLKGISSEEQVKHRADQICQMFCTLGKESGAQISGSVGIAFMPEHGTKFETLYYNSDVALYQAKQAGKNRYEIFK